MQYFMIRAYALLPNNELK